MAPLPNVRTRRLRSIPNICSASRKAATSAKLEKELEADSTGRFRRLGGSYSNVATALEAKYSLSDRLRLSAVATVAYYHIAGADGLDDRRQGALQSVSFDARYRLFDREHAPFGLTLSVEPHWGFTDETSGAPADQYGAELRLLADRELIAGRLFAALNVSYEPEQTRLRASGEMLRDSTLGVAAALALQVMPSVFIGAEARNLRHYEGLGLNSFAGQALYIGPTFYATFGQGLFPVGGLERAGLGCRGRKLGRARSRQFRALSSEAAHRCHLLNLGAAHCDAPEHEGDGGQRILAERTQLRFQPNESQAWRAAKNAAL
jgi:hypothetical protein